MAALLGELLEVGLGVGDLQQRPVGVLDTSAAPAPGLGGVGLDALSQAEGEVSEELFGQFRAGFAIRAGVVRAGFASQAATQHDEASDGSDAGLGGTEDLAQPGPQGDGRVVGVLLALAEVDGMSVGEILEEARPKQAGEAGAWTEGEGGRQKREDGLAGWGRIRSRHGDPRLRCKRQARIPSRLQPF